MSRRGASFVQSDLARTLRACKDAGILQNVTVRIESGAFVIEPLQDNAPRQAGKAPKPDEQAGDDIIL
ncbi:hypothetical protein [Azorhizobium sp. AG788]|uniref:hypothetical protein n=1 Tax=Azorhizobium sp. AG788 TaxID=2183897 RepID=UPI0031391E32